MQIVFPFSAMTRNRIPYSSIDMQTASSCSLKFGISHNFILIFCFGNVNVVIWNNRSIHAYPIFRLALPFETELVLMSKLRVACK